MSSLVRIPMENPVFEMEGRNNAYVVESDREVALVDGGVAAPETRTQLEETLSAHGLAVADVDRVFLTHWHPDHAGLAGFVQGRSGASVHVHEGDARLVADGSAPPDFATSFAERFEEWGVPESKLRELRDGGPPGRIDGGPAGPPGEYDVDDPAEVEPFGDGETFRVGDLSIEAIHAPGHTVGETCFAFEDDGRVVFTGDALLPEYTPNVGGADPRVEDALSQYLETLERIVEEEFDRGLPGHRDPIESPAERAREVVAHHRERAGALVDILKERGPLDAWTLSVSLLGDLQAHNVFLGAGEVGAHLDHLEDGGVVERDDGGYRVVDGATARLDDLFPFDDRD